VLVRTRGLLFFICRLAVFCLIATGLTSSLSRAQNLPDFTGLVKRWEGSVVNISAIHQAPSAPVDPIREYFRQFAPPNTPPRLVPPGSLGSGFIISSDGFVLTNAHVITGADQILVRLSDRRELVAEVVGTDEISDIALLKIDARGLPAVQIGRSDEISVGEWVLAIGSPFDFDYSVTAGIVSALQRSLPTRNNANYVPFIQTDVAINPGNSGGPLFNLKGEVIGINSQIYTRTGSYAGLSFAIPIAVAMEIVEQLKTDGQVARGWLGVVIQEVSFELAESFGLSRPQGALVSQVLPDSPAEKAGLQQGDIVTKIDGKPINLSSDLPHIVGRIKPDTLVSASIVRGRRVMEVQIRLGELLSDQSPPRIAGSSPRPGQRGSLDNAAGIQVRSLTDREIQQLRRAGWDASIKGLLVEKTRQGPATRAGILTGDILVSINGVQLTSPRQMNSLVNRLPSGQKVPVYLIRGRTALFVPLQIFDSDRN